MIGRGDLIEGLYVFKVNQLPQSSSNAVSLLSQISVSTACNIQTSNKVSIDVWHTRLGHISDQRLNVLKKDLNICTKNFTYLPHCFVCPLAKQKRLSFALNNNFCASIFDLIHCDIWGPFHTPTHAGHKYFLSIVDDHSRYTWIHLLKTKSEATKLLEQFVTWVQTQFGVLVKCIRSDNALELKLTNFLAQKV